MKAVIMQYGKMIPGVTYQELLSDWHNQLMRVPVPVHYEIVLDDGSYVGEKLDRLVEDADALIGIRITDGMLDEAFYQKHPRLKYIATLSHAYGSFDAALSRKYGITITNTVYGVSTIAEYSWAMLMHICLQRQTVPCGKTLGVIGQGAIGRHVARIGEGMGLRTLVWDAQRNSGNLSQLFREADIISLNAKVTEHTKGIICKKTIDCMKDGVVIVNTARGSLINEEDVLCALNQRKIFMAGLDVFSQEPPKIPTPLLLSPFCIATGHIGWMTEEAVYRTIEIGVTNFIAYLKNSAVSVINGEKPHEDEPY